MRSVKQLFAHYLTLVNHVSYYYQIYSNAFHILVFNTNFDSLTIIEVMKGLVRSFFCTNNHFDMFFA